MLIVKTIDDVVKTVEPGKYLAPRSGRDYSRGILALSTHEEHLSNSGPALQTASRYHSLAVQNCVSRGDFRPLWL
jgi:hypothetical protein